MTEKIEKLGKYQQRLFKIVIKAITGDFEGFMLGLIDLGNTATYTWQFSYITNIVKDYHTQNPDLLWQAFVSKYHKAFTRKELKDMKNKIDRYKIATKI